MGLFAWLFGPKDGRAGGYQGVSCQELFAAAADYVLRDLSFSICVNMVANAIGRCEFRTYRGRVELQDREYWLWNVEPNVNQNSSVFLHQLVDYLYRRNEALVVAVRRRDGLESLVVADAWELGERKVTRQNEYIHVRVDELEFSKTFRESDVLHFRLNQSKMKPVLDTLTASWQQMASLAMKHYNWDHGEHWKVHISQLASGADQFETNFANMIAQQVKPFFESDSAVLPEFDGYEFRRESVAGSTSADIRDLAADIFNFTAQGFLIPAVLVNGKVEATNDANNRFLTYVIDPLCDQLQEEINRKRYGYARWAAGDYLRVDSSSIIHYDLFNQAANLEKLVGSAMYSINDLLRALGQAPINEPWADKHYLTKNIAEMSELADALGEGKEKDNE